MRNMPLKSEIVVAMSGGVDSSAVAALLCKEGFQVTGVTMKTWDGQSSSSPKGRGCYGPGQEADIEDARAVCRTLGIPHVVVDLSSEFRAEVLDYVRREYIRGRTPNPCSQCNPKMKFGALITRITEKQVRFDYFATGHYAGAEFDEKSDRFLLKKARDTDKDQSYFLAFLTQEQIKRSVFPLGEYSKTEVRKIVRDLGLEVSEKTGSQDFIPGGYETLLESSLPGPILDRDGNEIGRHEGIVHHTVGQRKGLGISSPKPLYVTEIDLERNAVIVGERDEVFGTNLLATDINWISVDYLSLPAKLKARIRYRHAEANATVIPLGNNRVHVEFEEPQLAITPGQTIVFYDGNVVVGGGIIDTKEH